MPGGASGRVHLGVIGAGEAEGEVAAFAAAVGRLAARREWVLLCGGLGGVMEAASRGAAERGGVVIGILPGSERREGNPYLTAAVATGLGHARNAVIARAADALIAVGGGHGTLSEMALGRKMGKPVISLRSWVPDPSFGTAETPEEAVEAVSRALGSAADNERS